VHFTHALAVTERLQPEVRLSDDAETDVARPVVYLADPKRCEDGAVEGRASMWASILSG